jgi:hypothetical protein
MPRVARKKSSDSIYHVMNKVLLQVQLFYSIIETAKENNINPYGYLRYIFKYLLGVCFNEKPLKPLK